MKFVIHQYKNNGYNIVMDVNSGSIHVVDDIVYIQRGYEDFEVKLAGLGAEIEKVSSEKEIQKFRLRVG